LSYEGGRFESVSVRNRAARIDSRREKVIHLSAGLALGLPLVNF